MANKQTQPLVSGTNNYLNPVDVLARVSTDLFTPGVAGLIANTAGVGPATGAYAVSAQGSPNMTVAVNCTGVAYVSAAATSGNTLNYAVVGDGTSENVTVAANSTGSTRYDFLYLVLSASALANPAVTGYDAATLTIQRSTTQYVDSNGAPANSLLLAEITVANSASSIANASISDRRIMAVAIAQDGWLTAGETWTYVSATTFTISGDKTLKYQVGDKLKLTQSGSTKYFYVTAVSYSSGTGLTTVTVNGGTDYTLANATIYANYYSHQQSPVGFPQWFNYSPTYTGFSVNPSSGVVRFMLIGRQCIVNHRLTTNGTSNATGLTVSLPITSSSVANTGFEGFIKVIDNGTATTAGYFFMNGASQTTASFFKDAVGTVFTASGAKNLLGFFQYEI